MLIDMQMMQLRCCRRPIGDRLATELLLYTDAVLLLNVLSKLSVDLLM